jgi:hypothetical protein
LVGTDDSSEGEYLEMKDFSGYYIRKRIPMPNGCLVRCDDVWCWPDGLAHYVEAHGIRLPDKFVAHAAARRFRPVRSVSNPMIRWDERFWRRWCKANAPFAYEPQCHACIRQLTAGRARVAV